jgi:chemotaxis receptor (MCP) glutamine deamidase CheD
MFEVAKIYVRSIVGITAASLVVSYGMHVGQIGDNVLLAYLASCVAMVMLDKSENVISE